MYIGRIAILLSSIDIVRQYIHISIYMNVRHPRITVNRNKLQIFNKILRYHLVIRTVC